MAIYGQHRLDVGKMVSFCVKALTFSFLTAADRSTPAITELLYCTHSYSLHNFSQYFQAVLRFEPQLEDLMITSSSSSCLLILQLMLQQPRQATLLLMLGNASPCRDFQIEDLCRQVTAIPPTFPLVPLIICCHRVLLSSCLSR